MITLPVTITRLVRGQGPGDPDAIVIAEYLNPFAAEHASQFLDAQLREGAMVPGAAIYVESVSADHAIPYTSAAVALKAGWPIDVDAIVARMVAAEKGGKDVPPVVDAEPAVP